jgi:formate hydrogenlyase subunit 3/multisubunit Na+/H+ antiporter MnhD subunit
MTALLSGIAVMAALGLASGLVRVRPGRAHALGASGAVAGGLIASIPLAGSLFGSKAASVSAAWASGFGHLALELDGLSGFFGLVTVLVTSSGAWFGARYLEARHPGRGPGWHWLHYNVLAASMLLVVLSRNAVLFFIAWEAMSLSSFFLVLHEAEKPAVRRAAWIYLCAAHAGTAFIMVLFLMLGAPAGSADFSAFSGASLPQGARLQVFLLALAGFGVKAGIVPLHVWLPEAHPAAPSHVSAVMSGAMLKMGVYGLLRTLCLLGPPDPAWGIIVLAAGLASALFGALHALAQQDLKRLLAYSSVENIGIVMTGVGLGLWGLSAARPAVAVLGFCGALVHTFSHALFKGGLFLCAGAVQVEAGSLEVNRLGGLWKRIPLASAAFLGASVAAAGLPPFSGFLGEWLLLRGAMETAVFAPGGDAASLLAGLAALAGLALAGGIAAACFAGTFGTAFLGEARTPRPAGAPARSSGLGWPPAVLVTVCLAAGIAGPFLFALLRPALETLIGPGDPAVLDRALAALKPDLARIGAVAASALPLAGAGLALRNRLLRNRGVREGATWDCGFSRPTPRMQFTAASFNDALLGFFRPLVRVRRSFEASGDPYPSSGSLRLGAPDWIQERVFRPALAWLHRSAPAFHRIQEGRTRVYVLYIAAALLALVLWGAG